MTQLKKKNNFQSSELFGVAGWRLETNLIQRTLISKLGRFLDLRLQALENSFENWTTEKGLKKQTYIQNQQDLSILETKGLPKNLRHYLTGEFNIETRLDMTILELLSLDSIKKFVCNFLNIERFFIHYPPMIRFKKQNAFISIVPVHQDIAYNEHIADFVTAWLPLVDIDDQCGGVIVYEGTHLGEISEHQVSGAWSSRAVTDLSPYTKKHILMKAGDVLFFPPTLFHESAPHLSSHIRYSIDFRIFKNAGDTKKSYYDPFHQKIVRVN